jgi:hypothetical protein
MNAPTRKRIASPRGCGIVMTGAAPSVATVIDEPGGGVMVRMIMGRCGTYDAA